MHTDIFISLWYNMSTELPLHGDAVLQFIPQRAPFVMVDGLITCTDTLCESTFTPSEDCELAENGFFSEFGLTENIAQTGALHSGYLSFSRGEHPPVGFIGQVKNLVIHFLPPVGKTIQTRIEHLHKVANVSVINGKAFVDGELSAECEMKIFLQE